MSHPFDLVIGVVICISLTFGLKIGHRFWDPMLLEAKKEDPVVAKRKKQLDRAVLIAIWVLGIGISIKLSI
jgi:hypothetical protein